MAQVADRQNHIGLNGTQAVGRCEVTVKPVDSTGNSPE